MFNPEFEIDIMITIFIVAVWIKWKLYDKRLCKKFRTHNFSIHQTFILKILISIYGGGHTQIFVCYNEILNRHNEILTCDKGWIWTWTPFRLKKRTGHGRSQPSLNVYSPGLYKIHNECCCNGGFGFKLFWGILMPYKT